MTLYWLYDLPNWLFGGLTVATFVAIGLAGLCLTRDWVRHLHRIDHSHNDIVGFYLAAITVFYGITLGLVAIGTWTTFSNVSDRVGAEAQTVASLYRDVSGYDEPWRGEMQTDLKEYVRYVIDVSWPQQRRGIVPTGSDRFLERFQGHLRSFEVSSLSEQVYQAEAFKQFNVLVEARRGRLGAVTTGLPNSLWSLIILGALLSLFVTLFFDTKSFRMHLWMTACFAGLLGLLIFLIGALDNPFRGKVSVGPYAFEQVYAMMTAPHEDQSGASPAR